MLYFALDVIVKWSACAHFWSAKINVLYLVGFGLYLRVNETVWNVEGNHTGGLMKRYGMLRVNMGFP